MMITRYSTVQILQFLCLMCVAQMKTPIIYQVCRWGTDGVYTVLDAVQGLSVTHIHFSFVILPLHYLRCPNKVI